jgi:hypothetical protein
MQIYNLGAKLHIFRRTAKKKQEKPSFFPLFSSDEIQIGVSRQFRCMTAQPLPSHVVDGQGWGL